MGKFSDNLLHAIRGRRAAKRAKWPVGFKGMVMWCQYCHVEIARVPTGQELTPAEQQQRVDDHAKRCKRRHLKAVP